MATDLNDRFIKTVRPHFVTLSCVQTLSNGAQKVHLFSGFLADVGGVWFYMTAGHILRDIRTALKAGAKFSVWRLGDFPEGNRFKNTAIPYAFDVERWLVIEDEDSGLDYAAVALEDMYCQLLKAGGAKALDKGTWGDHVTEYDQWAVVGIPSETVSYDGKTNITARIVVAPIDETQEPPNASRKARNQFYGRLKDDSSAVVDNFLGMSGGPIFALKNDHGVWKYTIIGIQSGWYPGIRTITACPFVSLALALEQVVLKVLAEQATSAT